MFKPHFLFSTSGTITQPYRDEDSLETPYPVAVTRTHADYLTLSDTLAPTHVLAHHTIDAPSKGVYTQVDNESTQMPVSGYPPQETFLLSGPSTRQRRRRFWMVLSLAIGVLLILAIGVGVSVGIPSSLHNAANIKSNSYGGVDIGSDIRIHIGRGTSESGDGPSNGNNGGTNETCNENGNCGNGGNNPGYCISDNCPPVGSGNRATGSVTATLAIAVTAAAFLSVW